MGALALYLILEIIVEEARNRINVTVVLDWWPSIGTTGEPTTCVGVMGKKGDVHKGPGKGKSKPTRVHDINLLKQFR